MIRACVFYFFIFGFEIFSFENRIIFHRISDESFSPCDFSTSFCHFLFFFFLLHGIFISDYLFEVVGAYSFSCCYVFFVFLFFLSFCSVGSSSWAICITLIYYVFPSKFSKRKVRKKKKTETMMKKRWKGFQFFAFAPKNDEKKNITQRKSFNQSNFTIHTKHICCAEWQMMKSNFESRKKRSFQLTVSENGN